MFENVFSGSKGAGFIGLSIGLLTLVVFGLLGSAALGGKFNGTAPVSEQLEVAEARIKRLKKSVAQSEKDLAAAQERFQAQAAYEDLVLNRRRLQAKNKAMLAELERAEQKLAKIEEDFQSEVRLVRSSALGRTLAALKLNTGESYKGVTLTEISPAGIVISRGNKSKAIPASELPSELQARFHFTPEKLEVASALEEGFLAKSEAERRAAILRKAALEEYEKQQATSERKESQISEVEREIANLERKVRLAEVKITKHEGSIEKNLAQHNKLRSSSSSSAKNSTYSLRAEKERSAISELRTAISKANALVSQKRDEIRKLRRSAH